VGGGKKAIQSCGSAFTPAFGRAEPFTRKSRAMNARPALWSSFVCEAIREFVIMVEPTWVQWDGIALANLESSQQIERL
jgi:hypothetical protein